MKNGLSAGRAEHIGYQRLPSVISGLSKSHGKANPTRGIPTLKCQAAGGGGDRAGPVLPEALTLALEMAAATRSISSTGRYLLLRSLPTVAPTHSD